MSDFIKLLKLLWTNREQLLALLEILPGMLASAGESMDLAGNGAISASHVVRGGGGISFNARQVVDDAAEVLAKCGKVRRWQVAHIACDVALALNFEA